MRRETWALQRGGIAGAGRPPVAIAHGLHETIGDPAIDATEAQALLASAKDRAEHVMIVDLDAPARADLRAAPRSPACVANR